MIALIASLLISQISGEPPEATAVRRLVDTELISVASVGWQTTTLRRGERSFSLADEEWKTAFALVPEAHTLAQSLRDSFEFGRTLVGIGLGIELAGLVGAGALMLVAFSVGAVALSVGTIVALAIVCGGLGLVGAIVALIGVPALARSQSQTLDLVSTYNHGLARRAVVPDVSPGSLLVIPLGL